MMKQNKEIPEGYKDSLLGVIPEEWKVKKLGEICTIFKSGQSITSADISKEGKYPVYGGNGLRGYTNSFTHSGRYVLIGRQGALCGNITLVDGNNYVSEHAIAVQTDEMNCINYWAFSFDYLNLNRFSESSAQPGLSVEKLIRYKISIPPLPEQQKIAEILTTWDKAIEKQTVLIEKLELRKRGLMQQLLTGKKRLINFTSWQMTKAGSIFKNVSNKGFENERLLSATQEHGVIPRDMLEARVTMPSGETKSFKLVEIGDFVISLRSFQGGIEYSYYRGIVSPAYTVLKPQKEICNEYYKQYFKSCDFISRLAVAVIGIRDGKQISYDDFCFIKIPSPSLVEQIEIANTLIAADKEIDLACTKLITLRTQKSGLMQQLLTGKKRVNYI